MLTLQELKKRIKEPEGNGKSTTARYLMEHEKAVLKMDIREEAQLLVFGSGYALYRVGKHTTVFPVHGCGDYFYESNGQTVCIAGAFFEQQEWYVRLLLEGEDRLMKNRETVCRGKMVSYHAVSEEWLFLADPELSPLEQIVQRENLQEWMRLLTERQRVVVIQYFCHEKTQGEIARELGIAQPTVSQTIFTALKRMRKETEPLFHGTVKEYPMALSGGRGMPYAW